MAGQYAKVAGIPERLKFFKDMAKKIKVDIGSNAVEDLNPSVDTLTTSALYKKFESEVLPGIQQQVEMTDLRPNMTQEDNEEAFRIWRDRQNLGITQDGSVEEGFDASKAEAQGSYVNPWAVANEEAYTMVPVGAHYRVGTNPTIRIKQARKGR